MKVALGCDHGGFVLKAAVMNRIKELGGEVVDFGTDSTESVDYVPIAGKVARTVASGECERGILLCGTGIGMSIAANKVKGIRAACCTEEYGAEFTRRHNDANILCLGGRIIAPESASKLVEIFLTTGFEGGRHQRRVDQITELEKQN